MLRAVLRASGYAFLGLFGLALLAFWPEYLARLPGGGISRYVHAHAVVMTAWFALLIVQPLLVRRRRALHRALGALSYGLAPLVVVSGVLLAHAALVRNRADDPAGAGAMVYLPLSMIALFAVCYGLAIWYRRTQALHARFMIGTAFAAVDPIVSRVVGYYVVELREPIYYQVVSYGVCAVALIGLMIAERGQRAGRAVFPALLATVTVQYGLWFTLAQSKPWLAVARWFGDLPLT